MTMHNGSINKRQLPDRILGNELPDDVVEVDGIYYYKDSGLELEVVTFSWDQLMKDKK